jgi:small subunit ribosomal protein S5
MLRNQKQLKTSKELNAQGGPKNPGEAMELDLTNAQEEKVVTVVVNRVTKVVKGGKRFSFNALVVVGDNNGKVGVGLGKSNEVQSAIQKGTAGARKDMFQFPIVDFTIPHEIEGRFGAGKVWMKPAVGGTGLIAGGGVRAVLEAAGVHNVLTKSMGSKNHIAVVHATLNGLLKLRLEEDFKALRA